MWLWDRYISLLQDLNMDKIGAAFDRSFIDEMITYVFDILPSLLKMVVAKFIGVHPAVTFDDLFFCDIYSYYRFVLHMLHMPANTPTNITSSPPSTPSSSNYNYTQQTPTSSLPSTYTSSPSTLVGSPSRIVMKYSATVCRTLISRSPILSIFPLLVDRCGNKVRTSLRYPNQQH